MGWPCACGIQHGNTGDRRVETTGRPDGGLEGQRQAKLEPTPCDILSTQCHVLPRVRETKWETRMPLSQSLPPRAMGRASVTTMGMPGVDQLYGITSWEAEASSTESIFINCLWGNYQATDSWDAHIDRVHQCFEFKYFVHRALWVITSHPSFFQPPEKWRGHIRCQLARGKHVNKRQKSKSHINTP